MAEEDKLDGNPAGYSCSVVLQYSSLLSRSIVTVGIAEVDEYLINQCDLAPLDSCISFDSECSIGVIQQSPNVIPLHKSWTQTEEGHCVRSTLSITS